MHKKILILFVLSALTFSALGASSFGASLSPAFSVISHSLEIDVCGLTGNPIAFSQDYFKQELGTKLLGSVKVSVLPDESFGALTLNGKDLGIGDTISAHSLDKLKFSPKTDTQSFGSFALGVSSSGINYDVVCNVHILDRLNFAPTADSTNDTLTTFSGVCTYGQLYGKDPENDEITFEISTYPKKGILTLIDAKKGRYVYSPYKNATGDDSFEYTLKDCYGNRSSALCVSISLSEIDSKDVYSDMELQPSAYSATLLSTLNIFQGERIGGKLMFSPEKTVCLEDFLMMSMTYGGFSSENSQNSTPYPFTKSAIDLGLISQNDGLDGSSIITTSEAARIVERIMNFGVPEDEYVFAPEDSSTMCLERLVGAFPMLYYLEDVPNSPLSRANAVNLVVSCIPYK